MKRYILFSVMVICFSAGIASAQSYYPDELVQYKFTVNYADHTVTAFTKPVKTEIFPDPGKNYYWYSANQIRTTQGGYSGKLLNGPYSDFYLAKNLKEQGEFKNGLRIGKWNYWTASGVLRESIYWRAGEMNGPYSRYNEKGVVAETGRYRNGLLAGNIKKYTGPDSVKVTYHKEGKVAKRKNYTPGFIKKLFKKKRKVKESKLKP